jgi:hypothetical protein
VKALILALLATPAAAEQCIPPDAVTQQLGKAYGEVVRFVGLDKSGNIMVIYLNDDKETWTLFLVSPQGCATEISSGEGGGLVAPVAPPPEGDPA